MNADLAQEGFAMLYPWLLSVGLLLLSISSGEARAAQKMLDPLFGIPYNPQQVHFDLAPEEISKLCPDYRGKRMWVYAHAQKGDTENFIVSFFTKFYPDGDGPASIAPDPGTAIALHGRECRDDQSQWVMLGKVNPANSKPIVVDDAILDGLARDALGRYTKAFGGKQKFLDALDANPTPGDIAPMLQKHLDQLKNH
jgi:hypothetical protein